MSSIKFDNIFDAVTDDKEEANELKARADLMIIIRDNFKNSGLGKAEFAEKIGLTQSSTNNLLNGHIDKLSTDQLRASCIKIAL
jgi:predicted XRE-type DNA-binding protein